MRRIIEIRRADGERGAVAIIFALLLVALIGFIGLAVDLGAMYAKRQELQVAADSAALAAAQECATTGDCTGASEVALDYAERNTYDPLTNVVTTPGDNYVKVDVHGTQERWFLPVLGADLSGPVEATAYASWRAPSSGTTSLPLAFSMCDFTHMGGPSGKAEIIWMTKAMEGCPIGPDGLTTPGGFGMIGEGSCEVYVDIEDPWVPIDTGANMPCTSSELAALLGKVVLVPIFDACRRGGGGADPYCPVVSVPGLGASDREYHLTSFAAFELLDYSFPGSRTQKNCGDKDKKGSEDCIRGKFVEWVLLADAPTYGTSPDLGAKVVTLIDPRDIP